MSRAVKGLNFHPTLDRVLVKEVEEVDKKTEGGIYIPDSVQDKSYKEGMVVAIGPGMYNQDGKPRGINLELGDIVYYQAVVTNIIQGTKVYKLLQEGHIIGVKPREKA